MKKLFTVSCAILFVLSTVVLSYAADMPASGSETQAQVTQAAPAPAKPVAAPAPVMKAAPSKTKGQYPVGPIQKLERGFGNAAFGWTEIPKRIVDKTKESNPIKGFLLGVWQGSCKAFARTASGLSEIVTFPIGGYDKQGVIPDMPAAK